MRQSRSKSSGFTAWAVAASLVLAFGSGAAGLVAFSPSEPDQPEYMTSLPLPRI
jgi:hypothetical protein